MKMQNTKVGIFVGLGILFFCISIIMVGGDRFLFSGRYEINAKFKQIQGLAEGSVVSLAGINVGNIKDIHLDPKDESIVLVLDIGNSFKSKITRSAVASIKTQGALGDKYIYIEPGSFSGEPISEGDFIQVDESGDFLDMIAKTGGEIGRVVDAIDEFRLLIKALNDDGRAASIATNLDKLLNEGHLLLSDLRGGKNGDDMQESVRRLSSILGKIDESEGTLGALINDPTLHNKLLTLLGEKPRNKYLKPLIRQTIQSQQK
ncbi:MAG: hypothetical protein CL677_07230 [Bdellovibrionaceae bacterium]|nr:hypothetical protein [Pseudobdellovibrionaceae bacterium]|tara:strand:+ start:31584 stop:32366 length:783 start_codon:yes stop_codon:yes gene_type:complete